MSYALDARDALLITDEYSSYKVLDSWLDYEVIAHGQQYADGEVHTNTIESAWAVLKRAHHGSHHHYSRKWLPLYLAETGWKWNQRYTKPEDSFARLLAGCVSQ